MQFQSDSQPAPYSNLFFSFSSLSPGYNKNQYNSPAPRHQPQSRQQQQDDEERGGGGNHNNGGGGGQGYNSNRQNPQQNRDRDRPIRLAKMNSEQVSGMVWCL